MYLSEMAINDPTETIKRMVESGASFKLSRGVVGKSGHVIVAVMVVWAVIAFRLSENVILSTMQLGVGVASSLLAVWWTRSTQKFAEKNPAQAMLDGAEFLEYQKLGIEAKGTPASENVMLIEDRGGST
jgi:hypothetical protein